MSTSNHSLWAAHLRPGAVRFGRESTDYERTVAFYRDVVGLAVVGEFASSFGEDGTIFGLPDTTVQLEIIRAHDATSTPAFDQLVFYLGGSDAVATATAPLRAAGHVPRSDEHAYWAANGAVTFRDPDGRDVVFAPWVYGRDPEPAEHGDVPVVRLEWFEGDRGELRVLFAEAEDSPEQLDAYLDAGRVLIARRGTEIVGHLQLVVVDDGVDELKNMAVAAPLRGSGVGRALVEAALAAAAADGARRMVVATAAADVGNLRFYQRCGFRFSAVDRDAFTPDTGYANPVDIDGIPLRDRIWLDQTLSETG